MAFKHENEFDMEKVASFLQEAATKVKNEENPELLNEFKKVYKKNVPLSLRMYVAAYLTKEAQRTGGRYSSKSRRSNRDDFSLGHRSNREDFSSRDKTTKPRSKSFDSSDSEQPSSAPHPARTPRVQIDETLATTIFVGIGRNRRVYPRDLVGLLVSVAGIDRDRIGDIRVLANYSFVQLFTDDADKVIATLNGYDYRGRKLSVSYSRQKDDSGNSVSGTAAESSEKIAGDSGDSSAEDAAAYAAAEKAAVNREPFSAPIGKNESDETPSDKFYV